MSVILIYLIKEALGDLRSQSENVEIDWPANARLVSVL